jgi:serine/threonine-protein kinase
MIGAVSEDKTKVSLVDPFQGKVLDNRYRMEFRLATGGFGSVYRAKHVINGREVAIKVLHGKLAQDPGVSARFRREARALGQLKNPHTITAFDFGETADGTLYIVMELLHGESLYEQFRAKGVQPWRRIAQIARQVCASLGEAHSLGIVHRDLKPANIHLEVRGDERDFVKVLDFGIVKILSGAAADTQGLTHAGQVIGTFDYMSPEQLVGGEVSGRSDIFSLGVVMYEMLTGDHPYGARDTPAAQISAILSNPVVPASIRADVPHELDSIIGRCLQWEADRRYPKIDELATDLERLLANEDEPTQTKVQRAPSFAAEDETWLDDEPNAGPTKPQPTMDPNDLFTTLPGIAPPKKRR